MLSIAAQIELSRAFGDPNLMTTQAKYDGARLNWSTQTQIVPDNPCVSVDRANYGHFVHV